MNELCAKIEALLFLEGKPVSTSKLSRVCEVNEVKVENAIQQLQQEYNQKQDGLAIIAEGKNVQMVTSSKVSGLVRKYINDETTGELTQPSLEALTIIAYRGPVSKTEIELIRGVNCSLILRNLLIRGLIEEVGVTETESSLYRVTTDFLRFLGVSKTMELPNYAELNKNVYLNELLQRRREDFFQTNSFNTLQE